MTVKNQITYGSLVTVVRHPLFLCHLFVTKLLIFEVLNCLFAESWMLYMLVPEKEKLITYSDILKMAYQ